MSDILSVDVFGVITILQMVDPELYSIPGSIVICLSLICFHLAIQVYVLLYQVTLLPIIQVLSEPSIIQMVGKLSEQGFLFIPLTMLGHCFLFEWRPTRS